MPRKRFIAKREVLPDPKYSNERLARLINHVMEDGKKSIAEKVVYSALDIVVERHKKQQVTNKEAPVSDDEGGEGGRGEGGRGRLGTPGKLSLPIELLEQALDNVRPTVEVRSRRVGGATYQVPVEVRQIRKDTLAMRWIIQAARQRGEKGMTQKLANEILDAINGRGIAVKKREDMHKMAKANQAFAHFRWT
jgi:small subunit ribosomal protein S7